MKNFYKHQPNSIKLIWQQLHKKKPKSGFYNDLFDAVIDLTDSRQMTDDAPATINFVDYRLFSENAIEDHVKQIITIF